MRVQKAQELLEIATARMQAATAEKEMRTTILKEANDNLLNVKEQIRNLMRASSQSKGGKRNRNRTHRKRNHKRECTRRK